MDGCRNGPIEGILFLGLRVRGLRLKFPLEIFLAQSDSVQNSDGFLPKYKKISAVKQSWENFASSILELVFEGLGKETIRWKIFGRRSLETLPNKILPAERLDFLL